MTGIPEDPTTTGWFIIVTAFIWLIYEFYVLYYKKQTISNATYNLAKNQPIIPFIIGMLCAHFFW